MPETADTLPLELSNAASSSNGNGAAGLPHPVKTRWHPLRSGLFNLYRYEDEEFPFEQGRLLLRGNNGTGKSRVLALQLPFLLDGETAPYRIEPDGDIAKRIEWNLLLGKHQDRLGYTWVEFGRRDPDGTEHFLTLGCGLRAVEGRAGVDRWFFITPLRVRRDFTFQTDQRQPLTHERLAAILAGRGETFREATAYRKAVDHALFGLGERYGALIELLLRLRQPQLARKLDEKLLSAALGEALTPLRSDLIESVAESFRGLEAERADLVAQQEIARAIDTFLAEYRRYLRMAVRRRAAVVRAAQSAYEEAQRALRAAERARDEATTRRDTLEHELARIQGERAAAEGALKALQESPEMRGIQALQRTRDEEQQRNADRRRTESDLAEALQRASATAEDETRLAAETADAEVKARDNATAADHAAHEAALADLHRATLGALLAEPGAHAAPAPARSALEAGIGKRREALAHLRALQRKAAEAAQAQQLARQRLHERESDLRAAESAESEARAALAQHAGLLLENYAAWTADCRELAPASVENLTEEFAAWLERRDGAGPLEQALQSARAAAANVFAAGQAALDVRRAQGEAAARENAEEIARLEHGVHAPPEPPLLREADRTDRPGAPLWRVCDFHPDLAPGARAGLEAALEASGLLDAWILPDGSVVDPATNDTFLRAAPPSVANDFERLDRWLVPSIDVAEPSGPSLAIEVVARVLANVGAGSGNSENWVDLDGRWQLGPLTGRARKQSAEHIGESAREAARRRRLAELRERAARLEADRRAIEAENDALASRRARAAAEAQAFPDHEPLRAAGAALGQAITRVAQTTESVTQARTAEDEARRAHDHARQKRDADAADLGLLAWIDRLDALGDAIHAYQLALAALWPALGLWNKAAADLTRARQAAHEARQRGEAWRERARIATERHEETRGRLGALLATVGADEQQILDREKAQRDELERLVAAAKQADTSLRQTETDLASAGARIELFTQQRSERDVGRQEGFVRLQHLAESGLVAEAEPAFSSDEAGDWSAARIVELARRLEDRLKDAPREDEAWAEAQSQIYNRVNTLVDALVPHDIRPDTTALEDGLVVVRCPFQGRTCGPGEYARALADDLQHRERLLNQREREVIENHLLGDVAVELQALLRRAEEWVDETNAELLARPTSTGMQLKFAWEPDPDGPPGLDSARRCLRRTNAMWTQEDRDGLAVFLQERIKAERVAAPDRTWREQLGGALDYRRWHRFSVLRQQDDRWIRLTRRTYGTGSGGEKALALTIPQFAAAAAHYRSASPTAPRLILLDEVFVGIDSDMRAKCVGLLATFDLDFVMTSEREWGCYPTMPGLAICQLTARPGIDAVLVTRWKWNGAELREINAPVTDDGEQSGGESKS